MSEILFRRVFSMPSAWTFEIPPVRDLLDRWVKNGGKGWADPFAGKNLRAEFSNDMNPAGPAPYHMEAEEFVREVLLDDDLEGVLFDPPYSKRQISEHYKGMGRHATTEDTNGSFYSRVRKPLAQKVRVGGLAISFGWNSTGFGKVNGYDLVEGLLVCHGGSGHNDTIVTVERRVQSTLPDGTERDPSRVGVGGADENDPGRSQPGRPP